MGDIFSAKVGVIIFGDDTLQYIYLKTYNINSGEVIFREFLNKKTNIKITIKVKKA
jgi:hypothetical protein